MRYDGKHDARCKWWIAEMWGRYFTFRITQDKTSNKARVALGGSIWGSVRVDKLKDKIVR